ncbi:GNAT family N-acetyltransferase [Nocardioides rubriscoriae]|uniref:GNAT family N-acetyltransferase n=1 Tax=Nocardioides rubriscoriae TaxID=642762 RepID=UPI0011DFDCF6|nr:GNAT family N-acetyltransferase [Nocardioides rubriscoriae]
MEIASDELTSSEIVAFLEAHVAQLRSLSPPESTHALDLAGLRAPGVSFWSAYDAGELVGCAALKALTDDHAELKSMRTAPHRVGEGIGAGLVTFVLERARERGFSRVSLETGSEEFFAPARRLYARHGFVECPPFGDYRPDPLSTFMTRAL